MKLCIWIYDTETSIIIIIIIIIITHYSPSFKYSFMLYIIGNMAMKWLQTLYFYSSIMYVPECQWMKSNQFLKFTHLCF